jgi:hypothetical protein
LGLVGWTLTIGTAALVGGCGGDDFTSPSGSGGAGGAGGGPAEPEPHIYECHCFVVHPDGTVQDVTAHVCADAEGAKAACDAECLAFDDEINDAWLDHSEETDEACDPKLRQERLSGGVPNSAELSIDGDSSHLTIHLDGAAYSVPIQGELRFTGGCESSACEIGINHAYIDAGDVKLATGATSVQIDDVHLLNVGNLVSTHQDGYFRISSEQLRLTVNAKLAGDPKAGWFVAASGQDLYGYYLPSTGDFAIFGEMYSEAGRASLELYGTARNRPPTANAGAAMTVFADATKTATVTLDGRQTFDLDDDLKDVLWYEDNKQLGNGMTPTLTLGLGKHTITARAIDATHKWNDADTTVEVLEKSNR